MNKVIHVVLTSLLLLAGCCFSPPSNDRPSNIQTGHSLPMKLRSVANPSPVEVKENVLEELIWSSNDGLKYNVRWTTKDIYLSSNAGAKVVGVFLPSFTKFHQSGVQRVTTFVRNQNGNQTSNLTTVGAVSIKSLVGEIATFEVSCNSFAQGAPGKVETWWLTLDLSKSGSLEPFSSDGENEYCKRTANLLDYFSPQDVWFAIASHEMVQDLLPNQTLDRRANLIKQSFLQPNEENTLLLKDGLLSYYALEHFSFATVNENQVAVHLALTEPAATKTYKVKGLEVWLPIPSSLRKHLLEANSLSMGFLEKDSEMVAQGKKTQFVLKTNFPTQ